MLTYYILKIVIKGCNEITVSFLLWETLLSALQLISIEAAVKISDKFIKTLQQRIRNTLIRNANIV